MHRWDLMQRMHPISAVHACGLEYTRIVHHTVRLQLLYHAVKMMWPDSFKGADSLQLPGVPQTVSGMTASLQWQ